MLMRVQAVMNYTEMEAKVREATNNEPWGEPRANKTPLSRQDGS